jgi:hypothetical protein
LPRLPDTFASRKFWATPEFTTSISTLAHRSFDHAGTTRQGYLFQKFRREYQDFF